MLFISLFIYGILKGWSFKWTLALLTTSFILSFLAFSLPKILTPLCRVWFLLGAIMGKVTNPLVLGFVYFFIITPVALVAKFIGRDELKLQNKEDGDTFWENKEETTMQANSFKRQF